jgi:hypothetical protein
MEMLSGDQITDAGLADWRKLGQGLHARFLASDFVCAITMVESTSNTTTPAPTSRPAARALHTRADTAGPPVGGHRLGWNEAPGTFRWPLASVDAVRILPP